MYKHGWTGVYNWKLNRSIWFHFFTTYDRKIWLTYEWKFKSSQILNIWKSNLKTCSMPININNYMFKLSLDNLKLDQRSHKNLPNSGFWGWLSVESQPQILNSDPAGGAINKLTHTCNRPSASKWDVNLHQAYGSGAISKVTHSLGNFKNIFD